MIERSLKDLLTNEYGIDSEISSELEQKMDGIDYQNLINFLTGDSVDIISANKILRKYDTKITESVDFCLDNKRKFINFLNSNNVNFLTKNNKITFYADNKKIKCVESYLQNELKPENHKMAKIRRKLKESKSWMTTPEMITIASNAGLDMKRLAEAFDEIETDIDGDDSFDFYDNDYSDDVIAIDDVTDVIEEYDDAYSVTKNAIADITNNLGNLKISDFPVVIDMLEDLLDVAKQTGKACLFESKWNDMNTEGFSEEELRILDSVQKKLESKFPEVDEDSITDLLNSVYLPGKSERDLFFAVSKKLK